MNNYKRYNDYELLYLLNWHSDEALNILIEKYSILIHLKINAFKIIKPNVEDYFQECLTEVYNAFYLFDESYGKSLHRFVELVIERKIMSLLAKDSTYVKLSLVRGECDNISGKEDIFRQTIYEERIKKLCEAQLDDFKKTILREVIFEGESINKFASKNNLSRKYVYNHIYLLRSLLKKSDE